MIPDIIMIYHVIYDKFSCDRMRKCAIRAGLQTEMQISFELQSRGYPRIDYYYFCLAFSFSSSVGAVL